MNMNSLTTQTKGEIGELIVAADLLEKGFEVFKPLGQTKDFDLLISKDGRLAKIQVKSRHRMGRDSIEVCLGTNGVKLFDRNVVD